MVLTSEFHMYACAHMLSLSFNLVQRGFSGGNLIQERDFSKHVGCSRSSGGPDVTFMYHCRCHSSSHFQADGVKTSLFLKDTLLKYHSVCVAGGGGWA